MQQKKEMNYPEVISMEEYLTKIRKIKEKERSQGKNEFLRENREWVLAELYV